MTFQDFNLDSRLEAGIREMGWTEPTPIQEEAIPHVLQGGDLLGIAQTGTGKTAAFALPILQRLTSGKLRQIRALIVAPTRELAEQIHESFIDLGQHTRVRSTAIYGGVGKGRQLDALRRGAEVVVACPGRLLDLAGEGQIDLSHVEVLVLDEADRMCDMGFLPDIRRILNLVPKRRQTLFFSATMPPDIRRLSRQILKDPRTVQIGVIAPAKTVSHALFPVTHKMKKSLLMAMLDQTATGRVLIFTRTKRRARFLARDLEKKGHRVSALQGNMSQNKRQKAINGFRDGKFDILVATDIAARGIDVADISHVINFDMPDTVDAYTHRIGRTGRAEGSGEAYTFATQEDVNMKRDIERTLGKSIEQRRLPEFNYGSFDPDTALQVNRSRGSRTGSGQNGRMSSNNDPRPHSGRSSRSRGRSSGRRSSANSGRRS
ncbi:MAG: DEAD/DEAH box helicase [Candidatus Promineifilaceae bacterium]|nr:DEAD/DEAH box helicase [Candidatus Promineifilaceae bacterium]